MLLSPDSQVEASQRKFVKPELAYGLAMGGQTDSQVGSQVAESRKFHAYHWLMRLYNNRLLAIYLRPNLSSTKVSTSRRKSMQVDASGWPSETQVQVRLARAFFFFFARTLYLKRK